ncbi:MAG TPA: nucleoside transporter C-terminal domain-containing protein [Alphaproteobacteria bacterium]
MQTLQSVFGVLALLAIAWAISENRRAVSLRNAAVGLAVTVLVALLILKIPQIQVGFALANTAVRAIAAATHAGTSFLFGYVGGGPLPFELKPNASAYIFAFESLPIVLLMSVLTTLLFYWRIMPPIVRGFSWALERTMGVGGAVGVSTAANIFVGMVEAPLFIRPYLMNLSRSELFVVMTGGMAGVAGTVFAIYAMILGPVIPDAAGHIIVASVLGAPAAILISQIMIPDPGRQRTEGGLDPSLDGIAESTMDAIVKGTAAGLELMLNIAAMVIVFLALVYLVNGMLGLLPAIGGEPVSLERILGLVMAPVCWLMGVPWAEAPTAGSLMGIKTILNEFIAYLKMAALPEGALSPRSRLIMLYAMCGFANFGSAGIMIAGLATMAPDRRAEIASLGLKSIVSGTLCTCLLGAIVGALS